ncbi:MAG TPA: hypothetical protein V6D22_15930 [Candidatus Obscuribacterales bacterium]
MQAMVNAFVEVTAAQSASSAVQSRLFLQKKLDSTKQQHEAILNAVREFQTSHHTIDVSKEADELQTQIAGIKDQLMTEQLELSVTQNRIHSLSEQLGMSPEAAFAADKLSQDAVITQLTEKLAEYQVKLEDAETRYADDSPRIIRLKKSIERAEATIQERIHAANGKVQIATNMLPMRADDRRSKLLNEISDARHHQSDAKQKIAELQSQLSTLSSQLNPIPVQQAKFADLTREEQAIARRISTAESSLSDAQLNESVARDSSTVQVIDVPQIASQPESANGKKIFAIAEALLLMLCAGLFYVLTYFDPHLRTARKLSKLFPIPVAAGLGPTIFDSSLTPIRAVHRLRLTIQDWVGSQPIAVFSPANADGKTSVACGLALSYLSTGKRVFLIDSNFANPSLQILFNLPASPGLSDFVKTGDLSTLDMAVKEVRPNFLVLAAGNPDPNCVVEGSSLESLLKFAKSQADIVIFDTAAADSSNSALALLSHIKKGLVIARLGHTRIPSIKSLAASLAGRGVDAMAVLTNAKESDVDAVRLTSTQEERQPEMATAAW